MERPAAGWLSELGSGEVSGRMRAAGPSRPGIETRLDHSVPSASGKAAASVISSESGTGSRQSARARASSAYPPPSRRAQTRSPSDHWVPPGPTARIVPDASRPGQSAAPGGGGCRPWSWSRSARLIPAAATSIKTSPAAGTGSGSSAGVREPSVITIARIWSGYEWTRWVVGALGVRRAGRFGWWVRHGEEWPGTGGLTERPNVTVLKTVVRKHQGFESLTLRRESLRTCLRPSTGRRLR